MNFLVLAQRNFKEMFLDYLSLGLTIAFPPLLLLIFSPISNIEAAFSPINLAPGITLFGFVMLQFSSAMTLARDRGTALLSRLMTAPLRPLDFIAAYSLPYIPIALLQMLMVFGVAAIIGMQIVGNLGLVFLILSVMSLGYIGLGMIAGSLLSYRQVPAFYGILLLVTIFSGAWFDLAVFGSTFETIMKIFPFAHAIEASRNILVNGAGFSEITGALVWVGGYSLAFLGLGVVAFKRKMTE